MTIIFSISCQDTDEKRDSLIYFYLSSQIYSRIKKSRLK